MPEGPSIIILKEQITALHLEGQKVTAVTGDSKINQKRLLNANVTAIKSWGKHFLICFEDFTLKIHLMMFGSYSINEQKNKMPTLRLVFPNAEISFYTSVMEIIDEPLDKVYDWSADIMSDKWDPDATLQKLLKKPAAFICDVILDQTIFSGAGNIIKNEALFRARIHPLSTIGALPKPKLKELIRAVRDYSFDFFKWKKEFTLKKHWEAYSKTICPRCHIPFIHSYSGKTKRPNFYCENCQLLYQTTAIVPSLFR